MQPAGSVPCMLDGDRTASYPGGQSTQTGTGAVSNTQAMSKSCPPLMPLRKSSHSIISDEIGASLVCDESFGGKVMAQIH